MVIKRHAIHVTMIISIFFWRHLSLPYQELILTGGIHFMLSTHPAAGISASFSVFWGMKKLLCIQP